MIKHRCHLIVLLEALHDLQPNSPFALAAATLNKVPGLTPVRVMGGFGPLVELAHLNGSYFKKPC